MNVSKLSIEIMKTRKNSAFQFKWDNWRLKALAPMNWIYRLKKENKQNQLNSSEIPMEEDQLNGKAKKRARGNRNASCVSFSQKKREENPHKQKNTIIFFTYAIQPNRNYWLCWNIVFRIGILVCFETVNCV